MNEDTRLLRSQMSPLELENSVLKERMEQENSTLREENSAFKSRLETLERKIT